MVGGEAFARGFHHHQIIDKRIFSYLPESNQTSIKNMIMKTKEDLKSMEGKISKNEMSGKVKAIRSEEDKTKAAQMAKEAAIMQLEIEKNMLSEKLKTVEAIHSLLISTAN